MTTSGPLYFLACLAAVAGGSALGIWLGLHAYHSKRAWQAEVREMKAKGYVPTLFGWKRPKVLQGKEVL